MSALFFYLFLKAYLYHLYVLWLKLILLTMPKSYLASIQENNIWAKSFISLKENIDKPLSAILTLNTIAHTIGGMVLVRLLEFMVIII